MGPLLTTCVQPTGSHAQTDREDLLEMPGDRDELPAVSTGTRNKDTRSTHPNAVCGSGVPLGETLAGGALDGHRPPPARRAQPSCGVHDWTRS